MDFDIDASTVADRWGLGTARLEFCAKQRGDLARQSQNRKTVSAIGSNRDVEDRLLKFEVAGKVSAQRRVALQLQNTAMVLRQAQLAPRTEHPFRSHPADFSSLQRRDAVQRLGRGGAFARSAKPRPDPRERRNHPGPHVGRPAHYLEAARLAGVDFAQAEPVGVGMAFDAQDARHRHPGEAGAKPLDVFHFKPGDAQPMADFVRHRRGPERILLTS